MVDAPVGFAFSPGTVAAFNACGFALLPAYLSLFLAGDAAETENRPAGAARAAGVAMMHGWTPKLRLPAVRRVREGTGRAAMFRFGVSYATVDLSCTIPAFLVAVVSTFTDSGAESGVLVFGAMWTSPG